MSENSARKSLKKQGLKMISKSDANGIRMYAIVDAYTNLIISGEFTLTLDDVIANWL